MSPGDRGWQLSDEGDPGNGVGKTRLYFAKFGGLRRSLGRAEK